MNIEGEILQLGRNWRDSTTVLVSPSNASASATCSLGLLTGKPSINRFHQSHTKREKQGKIHNNLLQQFHVAIDNTL